MSRASRRRRYRRRRRWRKFGPSPWRSLLRSPFAVAWLEMRAEQLRAETRWIDWLEQQLLAANALPASYFKALAGVQIEPLLDSNQGDEK